MNRFSNIIISIETRLRLDMSDERRWVMICTVSLIDKIEQRKETRAIRRVSRLRVSRRKRKARQRDRARRRNRTNRFTVSISIDILIFWTSTLVEQKRTGKSDQNTRSRRGQISQNHVHVGPCKSNSPHHWIITSSATGANSRIKLSTI